MEETFILRQTGENVSTEERKGNSFMFYRFTKVFDRIRRNEIWKCMRQTKRSQNKYDSQALYKNNRNKIRMYNPESAEFGTKIGLKQGCALSPLLFSTVIDDIIRNAKKNVKT
jgi:hypothetical protein